MKVKELINLLQNYNPEHDIVVSGHTNLGYGMDFEVSHLHQYDDTNYVLLEAGNEYQEE